MSRLKKLIKDVAREEAEKVYEEKSKNVEKFGDLMSYSQAFRYLQRNGVTVKIDTIRNLASRKKIERIGLGHGARVTKESVNKYWGIG